MITNFKLFESDIDPYGEEDWEEPEILDDKDLIEITMETPLKIDDMIYTSGNVYHGVITDVLKGKEYLVYNGIRKTYSSQQMFYIFGYKVKSGKQFENIEIDPYGEEDWDNDEFVDIQLNTNIEINDNIYKWDDHFYGKIDRIVIGDDPYDNRLIKYYTYIPRLGKEQVNQIGDFVSFGCKIKKKQ